MQTLQIVLTLSHLGALHDARSRKLFSRRQIMKCKLLIGTETSIRRALISNKCHLCLTENSGEGRRGLERIQIREFPSTATSSQIPNHKTTTTTKMTVANNAVNKLRKSAL